MKFRSMVAVSATLIGLTAATTMQSKTQDKVSDLLGDDIKTSKKGTDVDFSKDKREITDLIYFRYQFDELNKRLSESDLKFGYKVYVFNDGSRKYLLNTGIDELDNELKNRPFDTLGEAFAFAVSMLRFEEEQMQEEEKNKSLNSKNI